MRWVLCAVVVMGGLFMASAVFGSDWRSCDAPHKQGRVLSDGREVLNPGGRSVACFDTDDTTDSEILNVVRCENIDVRFDPDIDGSDTTGTVNIMGCVANSASSNSCSIIENTTLDGDSSTDTDIINGAGEAWIWVDTQTNPAGGDARVMVVCNP